jgi:hypothetical protein
MKLYPSLHERLRSQHLALDGILQSISKDTFDKALEPGKWSIRDNVAHLCRYQEVFEQRVRLILEESSPSFDRYKAEDDPEFPVYQKMTTDELVEDIKHLRELLAEMISSLPDDQLSRVGRHPRFGLLTLVQWVEFFLLHEAHHLYTIFQIKHAQA